MRERRIPRSDRRTPMRIRRSERRPRNGPGRLHPGGRYRPRKHRRMQAHHIRHPDSPRIRRRLRRTSLVLLAPPGGLHPERTGKLRLRRRQSAVHLIRRDSRGAAPSILRCPGLLLHGNRYLRRIHREGPPLPQRNGEAVLHLRRPLDAEQVRDGAQIVHLRFLRDGAGMPDARRRRLRLRRLRVSGRHPHRTAPADVQIHRMRT